MPDKIGRKADLEASLIKLFGSRSRVRILAFLCGNPAGPFYQRQIMYETDLSLQAIQRELRNLVHLGIVKKTKTRNRVYYGINSDSPFFGPLGWKNPWGQIFILDLISSISSISSV